LMAVDRAQSIAALTGTVTVRTKGIDICQVRILRARSHRSSRYA
jgi:hypothetical protein